MAERVVWKYRIDDNPTIEMPMGALVVLVGKDADSRACIWVEVDPTMPTGFRTFAIVGTGQPIPAKFLHVGSYFSLPFIWHVYEVPSP